MKQAILFEEFAFVLFKPEITDLFAHLSASETSCEHNMSSPLKLIRQTCQHAVAHLYIQLLRSNTSFHLEFCLCQPEECKSTIHCLFSSVFGLQQLLREIYGSVSA